MEADLANFEMQDDLYSEQEKYFDYRESLHKITAKTLVIVGDKDWICPPGKLLSCMHHRYLKS